MEKTKDEVFRKEIRKWMIDHDKTIRQLCDDMNAAGERVEYRTMRQVMCGSYPGKPEKQFQKLSRYTKIEL